MKYFFSLCFFLLTCFLLDAQNSKYDRLSNQGDLPEDYTISSKEKYDLSIAKNIGDEDSRKEKSDRKKFYLESTYAIDDLLRSGYVLYNDPISEYVNDVMNEIVNSNPKLKSKNPRAYIFRSTAVNAFATDQGIIFISIGLLSQLENEAQLALILSHELVHVQEGHGLDDFLESTKVDESLKKRGRMRSQQIDMANLEKNRYSREQELEADDKGLDYFLNTDYSFESIQRVFDVLRYAYLPYDEIVFEKSALEKISVKIPEEYFLEEVNAINPAEEDEEQSTHPALSKRTRNFTQRLTGMKVAGKKDYIVSEETFFNVQLKARVELARLFLERQLLPEALYAGFLMEKIYGESDFSREIIGEALYGYSKFKNNKLLDNIPSPNYKDIEGESQQVFNLLKEFTKEELNVVAIAYNYNRYIQRPKDNVLREMIADLFADLSLHHDTKSLSSFYIVEEEISDSTANESKELSKIDKIKQNRKKEEDTSWHRLAFSKVLNDTTFRNIASEGFERGSEMKKEDEYFDTSTYRGRSNLIKYRRRVEKKGRSLGIDKVLVINPMYIQLKGSMRKMKPGLIESDERRESLKNIIQSSADMHNVDIQMLDANSLKSNDSDKLNDIMSVNEWIDNQLDAEGFLYQAYNQKEIEEVTSKYGTSYLMSVVVISIRPSNPITRFFNRKAKSLIFVTVFDTSNGKRAFIKSDLSGNYLNDIFLKSEFYDAFSQLSKSN